MNQMDEEARKYIIELEARLELEHTRFQDLLFEHIALRQTLCLMQRDREYSDPLQSLLH